MGEMPDVESPLEALSIGVLSVHVRRWGCPTPPYPCHQARQDSDFNLQRTLGGVCKHSELSQLGERALLAQWRPGMLLSTPQCLGQPTPENGHHQQCPRGKLL